jgi:hypothetical protein
MTSESTRAWAGVSALTVVLFAACSSSPLKGAGTGGNGGTAGSGTNVGGGGGGAGQTADGAAGSETGGGGAAGGGTPDAGDDTSSGTDSGQEASAAEGVDAPIDAATDADAATSSGGLPMCATAFTIDGTDVPVTMVAGVGPAATAYKGGTIEAGIYFLTTDAQFTPVKPLTDSATQQTLIVDVAAQTMTFGDGDGTPGGTGVAYLGFFIPIHNGGNSFGANLRCCTSLADPRFCARQGVQGPHNWFYSFLGTGKGATLTMSAVASTNVRTYTKQ